MNEISIDPYLHVRTVKGFEYGSNGNNISFISDYTGATGMGGQSRRRMAFSSFFCTKRNYVFQLCSRNFR